MEMFKLLVDMVVGIAWPLVIVILAIKFSGDLRLVIGSISKHFGKNRNFRAKFGSFEYESNLVSLKESDLVEIVNESSSEKRKILMKEKLELEVGSLVDKLTKEEQKLFLEFGSTFSVPNAFVVWAARDEIDTFTRLEKLGFAKDAAPLQGGEYIGSITPKGLEALAILKNEDKIT